MTARFLRAVAFQGDILDLPVAQVAAALPFYTEVMGFAVAGGAVPTIDARVLLQRDQVLIGLAENGGDPTQNGSFFEVDDVEAAFAELCGRSPAIAVPAYRIDRHGDKSFKVGFVIAPDGLCYCLGQQLTADAAENFAKEGSL